MTATGRRPVPAREEPKIRSHLTILCTLTTAALLASPAAGFTGARPKPKPVPAACKGTSANLPRGLACRLVERRWPGQFHYIDGIIRQESGWNPCASYPGRHDCGYAGINSCGVPQRNPCPAEWRGRLGVTWRAQVQWLVRYVAGRYGSPAAAASFKWSRGYY